MCRVATVELLSVLPAPTEVTTWNQSGKTTRQQIAAPSQPTSLLSITYVWYLHTKYCMPLPKFFDYVLQTSFHCPLGRVQHFHPFVLFCFSLWVDFVFWFALREDCLILLSPCCRCPFPSVFSLSLLTGNIQIYKYTMEMVLCPWERLIAR